MTALRVTVLGCGGSLGVPIAGGFWGSCDPAEPRNRRRRPSILLETAETVILVDTGPDARLQLLDADVRRIDAILYTHGHADHVHGIDDVRPFMFARKAPIPAHMDQALQRELEIRFPYAFTSVDMDRGIYHAFLEPRPVERPFTVGDIPVRPFLQDHGHSASWGFRFGSFAYSTDVVRLDEAAFATLEGVETWIVDATRPDPHSSHAHLAMTLEWIERVAPRRAYLTHMSTFMDYATLCASLPDHVRPAHDGLVVEAHLG